jgi:hypothetical protein
VGKEKGEPEPVVKINKTEYQKAKGERKPKQKKVQPASHFQI